MRKLIFSILFVCYGTCLAQVPTITNFTPLKGDVGTSVIITGTNFSTTTTSNIVYFGSTKATVTSATSTQLQVTVPSSSRYEKITVTKGGFTAKSKTSFNVTNVAISANAIVNAKFGNNIVVTSIAGQASPADMIISAGDFDNDGKVDIVKVGSGFARVHRNLMTAAGTITSASFNSGTDFAVNGFPHSVVVDDINSDGLLDLVTSSSGAISVLINNTSVAGTISFQTKFDLASTSGNNVRVADINLDGLLDLISLSTSSVKVYLNTSTGGVLSFGTANTITLSTTGFTGMDVADLNNDGKFDIVTSNSTVTEVYINNSTTGSFSFGSAVSLAAGGNALVIGDYDNDGDNDIYANVKFFENNINGGAVSTSSFTSYTNSVDNDGASSSFSLANIEGNNNVEIIAGTTWDKAWIFIIGSLPLSNSSFSSKAYLRQDQYCGTCGPTLGVDIDGDNKVDVVSSVKNGAQFTVTQNLMSPPPVISETGSLTTFNRCASMPSTAQTFTVSGIYLTANLVINALTGFQYSLDGITYTSSLSIPPTSGTLATTTVYVRMVSGTTAASGNISITSTGATSLVVSASGTTTVSTAITTQPISPSATCINGTSPSISVVATGANLTYQWYSNTVNSNSGGTLIPSATNSAYSVPVNNAGTKYYYVIVSGSCGTLSSNVSTAVVIPASVAGIASSNQTICTGSTPSNISLSGSTGTIQWQSSTDNISFGNISGATSSTLTGATIGALSVSKYFRAVVTNGVCSSVTSNVVIITVNPLSVAGSVSSNQTICYGAQPSDIILTGNIGTVQWQSSSNNVTFNNITGATSSSLSGSSIGNLTAITYFRAVVTSGNCSSTISNVVTVAINPITSAPTGSISQNFIYGATVANLQVTGSNIKWYNAATGGTLLNNSTVLLNGSTYYASQSVSGCESPTRLAVTANVTAIINSISVSSSNPTVTPGKYLYAIGITLPSGSSITNYEYEVTNLASNAVGTYQTTNNYFRLIDVSGISQYFATYAVRIRLQVNGVWQPFGIAKNINTNVLSSIAMSGTYCGTTLPTITKTIGCTLVPIATSFIFEVTDVETSAVSTYTSSTNLFSLTNLATDSFPIKFNHQYNVRVQYIALVDGEEFTSAFSSACTITTPVGGPVPTIISPACNSVVAYAESLVRCTNVANKSEYKFDLASASASHSLSGRTVNNFSFSLIDGYVSGTLYSVTPWVKLYGVWYEGSACSLTSPGTAPIVPAKSLVARQEVSTDFVVNAYPNPFAENFKLNVTSSIEGALQVKVYDMLSKLVENKELNVSDIETLEVGTNYPSGVYNVVVSQGENVQSLRVIKR